jgi:hypothetical protein
MLQRCLVILHGLVDIVFDELFVDLSNILAVAYILLCLLNALFVGPLDCVSWGIDPIFDLFLYSLFFLLLFFLRHGMSWRGLDEACQLLEGTGARPITFLQILIIARVGLFVTT